jgi:argininosuccinate lyase
MLSNIQVEENILKDEKYKYVFTVEAVNQLVNNGIPFRDAYKEVAEQVDKNEFRFNETDLHHTHEGSLGNLCNDQIRKMMEEVLLKFEPK